MIESIVALWSIVTTLLCRIGSAMPSEVTWLWGYLIVEPQPWVSSSCHYDYRARWLNCSDTLGFHGWRDYIDFTLTHCVKLNGWWYEHKFSALNMSDPQVYFAHHSCNINMFLFPTLGLPLLCIGMIGVAYAVEQIIRQIAAWR